MRVALGLVAVLLFAWPETALAQTAAPAVTLARGEMATVQLDPAQPSGATVSERRPAAPMSAFAQQAARDFSPGGAYEAATGETAIRVSGPKDGLQPLPANAVRLSFAQVPGLNQTVLTVENGYDQAVAYRAIIRVRGDAQPTDVCLVLPRLRSFEHWPYLIDSIDLFEFAAQEWREGDPQPCR